MSDTAPSLPHQGLTHFDQHGQAHMVDVAAKPATHRVAVAQGRIVMQATTLDIILSGTAKKGDVLGIARIAGIQAAKKTSDLIPLCHPLALSRIAIEFIADGQINISTNSQNAVKPVMQPAIVCKATVETVGPTGVEMEALCAVNMALLTIYDMCKAVDLGMTLQDVRLQEKHGGKSGSFMAP